MLKARLHAASEVKEVLLSAEQAADTALQQLATLLNTMCETRSAANLPLGTAAIEFDHVSQAISHAAQARAKILAAHAAFVETRSKVLPTIAWGDVGDCPTVSSSLTSQATPPPLQAVA